MSREQHGGVRKVCDCPRRTWPKCRHPWHFNFKPKGGPSYRFSLGPHITTKGDARTKANALRAAIENGTFGQPGARGSVLTGLTLRELIAKYRKEYLAIRRPATLKNVDYQIGIIARTALERLDGTARAFGDWTLDEIKTGTVEQYRTARQGAGVAGVNRDLSLLRAMFGWAIRMDYVSHTPFKRGHEAVITLSQETARSRRLQDGEGEALLAACGPLLRALVEAALETGCRKGELLSLQWDQVWRMPRAELFLPAVKTKTRRDRRIPLSARLTMILDMQAAALRQQLELKDADAVPGDLYVFGNELGEARLTVKRAWESAVLRSHGHTPAYVKRAGPLTRRTPGVTALRRGTATLTPECRAWLRAINLHFHDLRREAGSRWLEGGVPLHTVRDWLGHSNIAQTSTYLQGTIQGQHDAMRLFDERRLQPVATEVGNQGHQPLLNDTDANTTPSLSLAKAH